MSKAIESATFLSSTLLGLNGVMQIFGKDLSSINIGNLTKFLNPANAGKAAQNFASQNGLSSISGLTGSLAKLAVPVAAAAATFYIVKTAGDALVDSFYNYSDRLKRATESGNIEGARAIATEKGQTDILSTVVAGGAAGGVAGALIGSVGGPLGVAVGGVVGEAVGSTLAGILTDIPDYAGAIAASQASQIKVQKSLTEATEKSTKAMKDFESGNISAAEILKATSDATADLERSRKEAANLEQIAQANKLSAGGTAASIGGGAIAGAAAGAVAGSFVPIIGNVLGGIAGGLAGAAGGFVLGRSRNSRTEKQVAEANKKVSEQEKEVLKTALPNLEPLQRQLAASGGSFEDFLSTVEATDKNLFGIIQRSGTEDLRKSFANLQKEAERTRKAFDAMNLGLQNVSASSAALGTNLDNYVASQKTGNIRTESTIRTLEASVTNAAQGISDTDFSSAVSSASSSLKSFGASDDQVKKFEENLGAVNTAQKFFASASQETKDKLKADFEAGKTGTTTLEQRRDVFSKAIGKQLEGAKIGEGARNRISDALADSKLSDEDMQKVMQGDFSALDNVLKDLGQTTLKDVIPALQQRVKYEEVLIDFTKKRIDSENQVIAAQRGVLEAQLESQEIISKYGGKALTPEIRRENIIKQANIQAGPLKEVGISELKTGSAEELAQRSKNTQERLQTLLTRRKEAAEGKNTGEIAGLSGTALEAEQQRLIELAKSDYETTKKLIQLKEEELKLIGEKNKVEKDSINALISGDAEKFFELQQTKGAQAAIATGNATLQSAYGPAALGAAAQEIQRQQEAGVTELYGQQLGGAGGLTERGFGAALGARGITDARMAQVAAGTTMEEEMAKQDIRSLAGTLPNNAETQLMVAEQDKQTADIQYKAAEMQLEAAVKQVEARSGGAEMAGVGGMARGGIVYANRGIFVPRGTDTVPAMLTPGEFVVRREAVQRGNNLQLLRAMNTGSNTTSMSASSSTPTGGAVGMAKGGMVKYYAEGDMASGGLDISKLESVFTTFNTKFQEAINSLANVSLNIKLDATNVNVNLTGGEFLTKIKEDTKKELMAEISNQIGNYGLNTNGRMQKKSTITDSTPT